MGKAFINFTSDRGPICKIFREVKKLDPNKQNNPIKNGSIDLNRILTEKSQMAEGTLEELLSHQECSHQEHANQNDSVIPSYPYHNGKDQKHELIPAYVVYDIELMKHSSIASGSTVSCNYVGNPYDCFSENWK